MLDTGHSMHYATEVLVLDVSLCVCLGMVVWSSGLAKASLGLINIRKPENPESDSGQTLERAGALCCMVP